MKPHEPANRLTPPQIERLALLLEELGEAQQAIGKILRHGYSASHPDSNLSNREALEKELGDVEMALQMMAQTRDVDRARISNCAHEKWGRVSRYLHHNFVCECDGGYVVTSQ